MVPCWRGLPIPPRVLSTPNARRNLSQPPSVLHWPRVRSNAARGVAVQADSASVRCPILVQASALPQQGHWVVLARAPTSGTLVCRRIFVYTYWPCASASRYRWQGARVGQPRCQDRCPHACVHVHMQAGCRAGMRAHAPVCMCVRGRVHDRFHTRMRLAHVRHMRALCTRPRFPSTDAAPGSHAFVSLCIRVCTRAHVPYTCPCMHARAPACMESFSHVDSLRCVHHARLHLCMVRVRLCAAMGMRMSARHVCGHARAHAQTPASARSRLHTRATVHGPLPCVHNMESLAACVCHAWCSKVCLGHSHHGLERHSCTRISGSRSGRSPTHVPHDGTDHFPHTFAVHVVVPSQADALTQSPKEATYPSAAIT